MHCYTAQVRMLGSEIDRINKLLSIESLEEMTDEELIGFGSDSRDFFSVPNTECFEIFTRELLDGGD